MKTIVIQKFNDKDDKIDKNIGEFHEFEQERAEFLIEKGYVVEIATIEELKIANEKIAKLEKEIEKNKKTK